MEKPIITTETIEVTRKIEAGYDEKVIHVIHGDNDLTIYITLDPDKAEDDHVSVEYRCKRANDFREDTIVYFKNYLGRNKVSISNLSQGCTAERTEQEWLYMERVFNNLKNLKAFFKSI
jgi:hypothetical protein